MRYAQKDQIIKHSQWMILNRIHTAMLINEYENAKRFLLDEIGNKTQSYYIQDEAVFGTMLFKLGQENMITNQCVTFTKWDIKNLNSPVQFELVDVSLLETARERGCLFLRKTGPDTEFKVDFKLMLANKDKLSQDINILEKQFNEL
ncbi:core-2 i-branching beta--n-acetylglucosaminyltransferase family protein [Stylonychia lemnae]|uniref:Core-2 i-branching beta--n-acetylglucosaminyltransferase family protein n=1 Tax=Stylonychia lemnae TaxID=5949 RepID=A0A078B3Y2_STYLE|nr:core-2 i-branching beta--n-acetylglucosaminyltransferase family protein [Stylonychia lemnae]|eukprot:CDW87892.1 core-2 i-branching beta--n-acetylglucosaminyltransferase family protein [Stylonychia lemnae]